MDAGPAAFALRCYREHADVQSLLRHALQGRAVASACELGSGYGRMTVVLGEFAAAVTGFERQPAFVDAARPLLPGFTSHQVDSLSRLPAADRSFDVVLTFTVLQHLTDRAVSEAAAEVRRIVRPGGLVLLCEDTNPAARFGDVEKGRGLCVIGRPVETYAALLTPLRLLTVAPRRVEPTYPSPDVGHFMLFRA